MRKLVKFTFALCFLILAAGFIREAGRILGEDGAILLGRARWFSVGFLAYFPLHVIFRRFIVLHVFSHELTHALWASLFGGRVDEIYISRRKGGYTTYSKGNMLVTLAPYFFPLYALFFLFLNAIALPWLKPAMLFMVGLGLGFHVLLTLYSLRLGQPDLRRVGLVFSFLFIITMNLVVIGSILSVCVGGRAEVVAYLRGGIGIFGDMQPLATACKEHFAQGASMVLRWVFPPIKV